MTALVLRYTDDLVVMLPPRRMPASPSFLQSMIATTGEAPAAGLVFEYLEFSDFGRLLFVSLQARAVFARALRVGVHEELLIPVPPFLGRNSNHWALRHIPPANLFNRDTSVSLEARDLVPVPPLSTIQRQYDNNTNLAQLAHEPLTYEDYAEAKVELWRRPLRFWSAEGTRSVMNNSMTLCKQLFTARLAYNTSVSFGMLSHFLFDPPHL